MLEMSPATAVIVTSALTLAAAAAAPPREPLNERFRKPDLDVKAWVDRFEKPGREVFDRRREIVAAVGLRPGNAVADVGAGTGLFTMLFSQAVGPDGKVYAVDIAPRFLEHISKRARAAGATNVQVVRGTDISIELPPASVDRVFLCDTYHHFEHPQSSLASIRRALRPGGELVVVDYHREPGKTAAWVTEHVRAGQTAVTKEIETAGFTRLEDLPSPSLKENYLLRFRRR
jgi:ubiquinone/menaquinone biosynthesis C-methylase UbiE